MAIKETIPRFRAIYRYRHTLLDLAWKQLKAKYANSCLGIAWAFVNPLLIMAAISFVFTGVLKTDIEAFPVFVLAGILPWMFFANVITDASNSILSQGSMLRQFNLPREIIPLGTILSNFLNFLIGWLIIYPVFALHRPEVLALAPFLAVCVVLELVFAAGIGLALSALNVFYRDIGQLLGVITMFWFWVTPVFYPAEMVPAGLRWVTAINPVAPFIIGYQHLTYSATLPSGGLFLSMAGLAVFSLAVGAFIFSQYESRLLKRI